MGNHQSGLGWATLIWFHSVGNRWRSCLCTGQWKGVKTNSRGQKNTCWWRADYQGKGGGDRERAMYPSITTRPWGAVTVLIEDERPAAMLSRVCCDGSIYSNITTLSRKEEGKVEEEVRRTKFFDKEIVKSIGEVLQQRSLHLQTQ